MPALEIGSGLIFRKAFSILTRRLSGKTDERDIALAQEAGDLRDSELMLLHMKQQIAALAGGEEVRIVGNVLQRRAVRASQQLLATAADVVGAAAVAALRNKRPRGPNVGARQYAIEPDVHEAARAQQ